MVLLFGAESLINFKEGISPGQRALFRPGDKTKMAEETSSRPGAGRPRPRSPFLTVYRWPITMTTSIIHRMTGVGLAFGGLLLAGWLVALALGPDAYEKMQTLLGSIIGRLVLFGFTWALIFHMMNGIRHLAWDAGHGFEKETSDRTGYLVLIGSAVVTLAIWFLAWQARG